MLKRFILLVIIFISISIYATSTIPPAITEPIPINELKDFDTYSPVVKNLITKANELTHKHLTYLYGSADPNNMGMDCSGTIYYLLKSLGVKDVPRQSDQIYSWAEKNGKLIKVKSQEFNSPELSQLKPGDLLFWTGTYAVKRDIPITHVMIYLGLNAENKPLMFGASDGRTYQNKKMWGVSVFDFRLSNGRGGNFVGYSCIPTLTCPNDKPLPSI